jgi:hypothetical protein
VKGGEKLALHEVVQSAPAKGAAPKSAAPIQPPANLAALSGASAPDLAQMEQRLLAQIPVTDDELRELVQARARAVQSVLLESGKIQPQRIFVLAPKPVNPAAQGETRAIFSLE